MATPTTAIYPALLGFALEFLNVPGGGMFLGFSLGMAFFSYFCRNCPGRLKK